MSSESKISVVRGIDELMQVIALRAQTYMLEQNCPYREEFDGNDLSGATHLLARHGDEPIAAMRIRWFANFAKFERICVRAKSRGGRVAIDLVDTGCAIAARKGYAKVLVHANEKLVAYWQRVAYMTQRAGRPAFSFSNITYVEMERTLEPDPQALTIDTPPHILLRPEGAWDSVGVLEPVRVHSSA